MSTLRDNVALLSAIMENRRSFDKATFHRLGKKVLNQIAIKMDLLQYEVRSNKGGPGVNGEVILHTPNFYVMISGDSIRQPVLYRSCEGMKDYAGGQNNFTLVATLASDEFRTVLNRLAARRAA